MNIRKAVTFVYRNWRGEIEQRTVYPIGVTWEENEYHDGPQWFLNAYDPARQHARRSFAIEDILTPIRHIDPVHNEPRAPEKNHDTGNAPGGA